jgi:RNA polymerase sigma factor (sigma-70 family)
MATRQANPVLKHIRTLAGEGNLARLTDRQLLERFTAQADQAAFEVMVRRHGPTVLRVCRSVLRDEHAADDAFQATFLVLARKAGSLWRQELLGSWLYGVAHRVAARARVEAAKRLNREARAETHTVPDPAAELSARELCAALEEEMSRLPEKYRAPFYLCHVEGRTRDQAARQLGRSVRTLQRLLERGRGLLQARLSRRGVSLSAALLAATLTHGQVPAALPAALLAVTLAAARAATTGGAVPVAAAALAGGVLRRMAGTRLKILAVLAFVAVAAGAGLVARPGQPPEPPAPSAKSPDATARQPRAGTDLYGDPLPPGALLRLGSLRLRTGAPVFAVLPTPDGKGVYSGSWVPYVPLWDVATGKEVRRFDLPQKPGAQRRSVLGALALSPDGRTLATATQQGTVYLWDTATARPPRTLAGPAVPVLAIAFAPDGQTLAAAVSAPGEPAEILLWDTATGKERRRWQTRQQDVRCLVADPDGRLLATAGEGATVQLWDAATGKPLQALDGHGKFVWAVAFAPDGKRLATASQDETVRLWDVATGKLLHKFDARGAEVRAVAFSPDRRVLAAAGSPRSLLLWDAASGKQLASLTGLREEVRSLAFFRRDQGLRLATGNGAGTVEILDLPDSATLRRSSADRALPVTPLHARGHRSGVYATAVSPDGKVIATGSQDCTVRLWDAVTGKEFRRLEGHIDWVCDLCFSPEGKYLASGGNDGFIFVREAATGKVVRHLEGHCVTFSPDGRLLATATTTRNPAIQIWDFATGRELRRLHGHKAAIFRLAFSPDGKRLASGGMGALLGLKAGNEEMEVHTMRLWDVASGKLLFQFGDPREYVYALAFTPDGKTLISGGDPRGEKDPGPLRLWETATGKERGPLPGHRDRVWSLTLSPDGRVLASGSSDGTARLWDLHTREEIRRLEGHRGWVTSVAFGPGGRTLVTGSWDTTALVWDVADLVGRGRLPKIDPVPGGR